MTTKSEPTGNAVRQEVNITRIFDAPRELVFKMWIDPQLVELWWGHYLRLITFGYDAAVW